MKPSFAVLTRGMYDEAPFLHEFVSHYVALGFRRIYYINTSPGSEYLNISVPSLLLSQLSVINASNTIRHWQQRTLNDAIRGIPEDWVLIVDLDEFLMLGNKSIQQFIESAPSECSIVRFRWHMHLSKNYSEKSVRGINGAQSKSLQFKTMALTNKIATCGLHDIFTSESVVSYLPDPYTESCYIAHYPCRGLYDLVIRIVGRNYEDAKSAPGEAQKLRTFLCDHSTPIWNFPFRFNLYRMELSFPEFQFDSGHPKVEIHSDSEALQSILREKLSRIGLNIPPDISGDALDYYMDDQYDLRDRLLRSLPSPEYSRLHTELGMSHQALTHIYVNSIKQGEPN